MTYAFDTDSLSCYNEKKKCRVILQNPPKETAKLKRIIPLLTVLLLFLTACGSGEYRSGLHHAEIDVKDYGTISVELDADTAPISVENFCELAEDGFYNGLTFHRIISGFMIQGGDPNGDGSGGSDQTIHGEFSSNGTENNISHVRGTISMARSDDYNSASSQFFIVHQDTPSLDGLYAAFGHVTDGMDVVDAICENTPVEDSNGTVAWWNQPIISEIRIID